ncbi:MAG: ribosomal protein [Parachlamydiales bacterium]|nr:ribosomal protein [Parachlamydiales bacterium]
MKLQLLLLKDVEALGKKGDVVSAKSGYVRNFLLPQRLAVIASPNTLRKQERLREERAKQAVIDRKESEDLAKQIETVVLETRVKVDPEGHMYGSVSASDIATLFQESGLPVDRKFVQLTRPIKVTGVHKITLKLKEGVELICQLTIIPEGIVATGLESVVAPIPVEEPIAQEAKPTPPADA